MSRSLRHPTHPACVCLWRNGESGRWTHQPRRPTDPSYPTSRDPSPIPCHLASRPSCRTDHHHLGPAWPPDHQVPPESLKQGQELAIPTSAAVAVSAPVMTLALVLVRQKPGGLVPRLALARSLVPTRNTFLPPLHTHTTTMPTPLTLAEPRLPWELFLLQVPREPKCPGD